MKNTLFYAALIAAIFLSNNSFADVLVKSITTMDQLLGIGSSKSETSVYIKGDKNRTDTKTTFDSPIFKLSEEGMKSEKTEIFRLDKDIKWNLDPRDRSYSEVYLRSLDPGKAGNKEEDFLNSPSPGPDIGDYAWTVKVDISDSTDSINGFKSTRASMNAVGANMEDQTDSMFVALNVWKCKDPDLFSDVERYQKRFLEVAGFEEDLGLGTRGDYTSGFGEEFETEARRIEEMQGYPVKTILLIQKSAAAGQGESGISDLMNGIVGGDSESELAEGTTGPRITVLSLTNEVISVDNSAIDDDMFEIPEGFIKK